MTKPQADAERRWVQENCPYCHSDGHTRWDNQAEWGSKSIDDRHRRHFADPMATWKWTKRFTPLTPIIAVMTGAMCSSRFERRKNNETMCSQKRSE